MALRFAVVIAFALALPLGVRAASSVPFDMTDPTPRPVRIGIDAIAPDPACGEPCLDPNFRVTHVVHGQMTTFPGVLQGLWASDGVSGTITVPEAALRAFIDAGGTVVTIDPDVGAGELAWTDLVYHFDVASGHGWAAVTGTVERADLGLGRIPLIEILTTGPGVGPHVAGPTPYFGPHGYWDLGAPLGAPGDPNNFLPGDTPGVIYVDYIGAPLDAFCSEAMVSLLVLLPPPECPFVSRHPYDPDTGLVNLTGPEFQGSAVLFAGAAPGDLILYEVPEPGSLALGALAVGAHLAAGPLSRREAPRAS